MANHNESSRLKQPHNPAEGLVTQQEWQQLQALFALSGREAGVARLLFEGRNRDQIALALRKPNGDCLSPETVRVYIDRLWQKLNVTDRAEMAIRILRVQRLMADQNIGGDKLSQSL